MTNIDFLPNEYREKYRRRQSQPWQVLVAIAIVSLVALAAFVQHDRTQQLKGDLAVIDPIYDAAVQLQKRLGDVQKQLTQARANAELYVYLRHPWPRTQLLTALVAPLPKEITLQQVQIVRELPTSSTMNGPHRPIDQKSEEDKLKLAPPASRDLAHLRNRLDPLQTVVVLTGTASEIAALHHYLGELDAGDIFNKADLDCFNSLENAKGGAVLQFRAVLAVQPGYGQPGGPTAPDKKRLARVFGEQEYRSESSGTK